MLSLEVVLESGWETHGVALFWYVPNKRVPLFGWAGYCLYKEDSYPLEMGDIVGLFGRALIMMKKDKELDIF